MESKGSLSAFFVASGHGMGRCGGVLKIEMVRRFDSVGFIPHGQRLCTETAIPSCRRRVSADRRSVLRERRRRLEYPYGKGCGRGLDARSIESAGPEPPIAEAPGFPADLSSVWPHTVFVRRTPYDTFEGAAEILRILVSQSIGDIAYGFYRIHQKFFGYFHRLAGDMVLGGRSCLFFYYVAEVIRGEVQLFGLSETK